MINKKELCAAQKVKLDMQMPPEKFKALLFLMDKFVTHRDAVLAVINEKMKGALNTDQKRKLVDMLEKAAARKEETESKLFMNVQISRIVPVLALGVGILAQTQGFCADNKSSVLDGLTTHVMQIAFDSSLRRALLTIAGAWGVYQAIISGSFKPVLFWGGIGLAVSYVPKLIDIISNIG